MNLEQFRVVHQEARLRTPKIFLLASPDLPATDEALDRLEQDIGIQLPLNYRAFLKEFGGGNFGLMNVFSADPNGEWYLPARLEAARSYLPDSLLPFSDDFAGGIYVLRIVDGRAIEPVLYWNADGGLVATEFSDVLELIARCAFEAA